VAPTRSRRLSWQTAGDRRIAARSGDREATSSTVDAIREIGMTIGQMNEIGGRLRRRSMEQGAANQETPAA